MGSIHLQLFILDFAIYVWLKFHSFGLRTNERFQSRSSYYENLGLVLMGNVCRNDNTCYLNLICSKQKLYLNGYTWTLYFVGNYSFLCNGMENKKSSLKRTEYSYSSLLFSYDYHVVFVYLVAIHHSCSWILFWNDDRRWLQMGIRSCLDS